MSILSRLSRRITRRPGTTSSIRSEAERDASGRSGDETVDEDDGLISAELFARIRRIEIRTRHLVDDSFAGDYHAVFKGRGMSFDEVRPYQPGDEIRTIDWNVTARMGEPYIKRFVEERELTVFLAVDVSRSLDTGSRGRRKRALATELAAVLAFAATTNDDKIGLLLFSEGVDVLIPPRKGRRHVLRLIREVLKAEPRGERTDVRAALDAMNHALKRRSIVFLVSDFAGDAHPERYRNALVTTNRRHDVIAVGLDDPLDAGMPDVGLMRLEDAETGEIRWVDTRDAAWRAAEATRFEDAQTRATKAFADAGVDLIRVSTEGDYAPSLAAFFRRRLRRLAAGR